MLSRLFRELVYALMAVGPAGHRIGAASRTRVSLWFAASLASEVGPVVPPAPPHEVGVGPEVSHTTALENNTGLALSTCFVIVISVYSGVLPSAAVGAVPAPGQAPGGSVARLGVILGGAAQLISEVCIAPGATVTVSSFTIFPLLSKTETTACTGSVPVLTRVVRIFSPATMLAAACG